MIDERMKKAVTGAWWAAKGPKTFRGHADDPEPEVDAFLESLGRAGYSVEPLNPAKARIRRILDQPRNQ